MSMLNAKWLSSRLENTLRENPRLRPIDIRKKVTRKWNIVVTKSMVEQKCWLLSKWMGPL